MSYDVWLVVDTGGPEPAAISDASSEYWRNITSNVGPMFRDAMGGIPALDGVDAGDAVDILAAGITKMERDPDHYRAMNPPNGWGDYDSALDFLRTIHGWCVRHPKATVRVSW